LTSRKRKGSAERPASGQAKKFVETAENIDADEDEAAFERRLRQIAKAKPKKEEKTPDK
jgi:hypothetical protein